MPPKAINPADTDKLVLPEARFAKADQSFPVTFEIIITPDLASPDESLLPNVHTNPDVNDAALTAVVIGELEQAYPVETNPPEVPNCTCNLPVELNETPLNTTIIVSAHDGIVKSLVVTPVEEFAVS